MKLEKPSDLVYPVCFIKKKPLDIFCETLSVPAIMGKATTVATSLTDKTIPLSYPGAPFSNSNNITQ